MKINFSESRLSMKFLQVRENTRAFWISCTEWGNWQNKVSPITYSESRENY